jgi:hypothetical protein
MMSNVDMGGGFHEVIQVFEAIDDDFFGQA